MKKILTTKFVLSLFTFLLAIAPHIGSTTNSLFSWGEVDIPKCLKN